MKLGWIVIALGLAASVPLVWNVPGRRSVPLSVPLALSWPSDGLISEPEALERCESALKLARREGQMPQADPAASGPRAPLGNARTVRVVFAGKNSRDIDLDLIGWCRVWADGKTAIIKVTEANGKDFLASSYSINVRDGYLDRVKAPKMQVAPEGFTGIITNRNDFPIKGVEMSCRVQSANGSSDATITLDRVIPAGGSSRLVLAKAANAQSATCRVVDFYRISPVEQRLVDVFGQAGGQASLARLRQDALRVGVPVDDLVEPYIELTRALASNRR